MNSFQRFQELQTKRLAANNDVNSNFVINGYNSTNMTSGNAVVRAAIVNMQEKDKAYIYTLLNQPLTVGSIWTARGLHLLVSEEIAVIKEVKWHKYIAYIANVDFSTVWGFFKGPEESFINIDLKENSIIHSNQKPILVLPSGTLDLQDKVVINGRAWVAQEYDAISTAGITYYSLVPSTISKSEIIANQNSYIVEKQTESYTAHETPIVNPQTSLIEVSNNIDITLSTLNGYFVYNKKLDIKQRTATSVVFSIPFGISDVEVKVKDTEGEIVTRNYHIVN